MQRTDTNSRVLPEHHGCDETRDGLWQGRVLLALFALTVALGAMIDRPLSRRDEPRVAGIARAMVLDGDYVTPRLNGELFLEYPPLGYVPMALTFQVLGESTPFAAHLASALAGLATVLLTFVLGRRAGGERVGLIAGFALASTAGFIHLNERALVDPWLLFWITLSLTGFQAGILAKRHAFAGYTVFYLALAGGVLTKGLIGFGLPVATVGAFVLVRRDWALIVRLRPWWGALIFAAPLLLWGGLLYQAEGAAPVQEVIRQSLWRFFSGSTDHAKPPWFYLPVIFGVLGPLTMFVPLVLWRHLALRRSQRIESGDANSVLFGSWFAVMLIALSVASAKRNVYLAPIYPAFAVLFALWWESATRRGDAPRLDRWAVAATPWLGGLASVAAVVVAGVCGGPLAGAVFAPGVLVLVALIRSSPRRWTTAPWARFACLLIGLVPLVIAIRIHIDLPSVRERDASILFRAVSAVREDRPLFLYRAGEWVRGGAVFYLGHRVPVLNDRDALRHCLAEHPRALVIARTRVRDEVDAVAGSRLEILAETAERASRRLELLCLASPNDPATRSGTVVPREEAAGASSDRASRPPSGPPR